ncbi:aldehyde dehydrogenase family protein [Paracandidimonas soli]|uniref:Succinate-semialdehyde dehydrogenase/glutarate-semialdehyde dehydrogenase n=1 Tax=Paracandidimonas soli TaxID=1917182 RepID=A0A4R3UVB4_9BURK|nr:aldehyde dehydrogenase family protein [Paracandidimonas soli]TCU96086.1 succinate-semialdehyde dehydrogenase/glutarate-semialdehyde dehydrogenase [Paracandidimonas soli]
MEVAELPETLIRKGVLIGGDWIPGESGVISVVNKYRGVVFAEVETPSRTQVAMAVETAHAAFVANSLGPYERGRILDRAADIFAQRKEVLQNLLCMEAGFTMSDAAGEIGRCEQTFRLSAEEARRFVGEAIPIEGAPRQAGRICWTMRIPLGVVCAITPFNAPLNTVAHKVAPALAAGNAVILKPSPRTPVIACELADILIEAGLPKGMISVLHGGADVVHALLDEPLVQFYAFTGSTEAGLAIQQRAGLRRTQMELGSIAFGVLCEDADLDFAMDKIINAAYRKAGQVCTSIQVLLVHESIYQATRDRLTKQVQGLAAGDPSRPETFVGPVISTESADRIEAWIREAVQGGAVCLAGGSREGNVIAPTLLEKLDACMRLGCQEVFGPVMSLAPFSSIEEAIQRINGTPYGLATGVFTNRLDDAFRFARELQVGGVHINETSSSRVDMMPYGGSKASGFGREGPYYAMREMSEERVVTFIPDTHPGGK